MPKWRSGRYCRGALGALGEGTPLVSVVIPTRDRARRLEAALASLRAQTLRDFEVIVVDDGSADDTPAVLARFAEVRVVRRHGGGGPGAARNAGWPLARAPLVAFMDDDCVAEPGWLEAGLAAWDGVAERFVQGSTTPLEDELAAMGPWSYTIDIRERVPEYPTCNILYPRALLERLGGFDAEAFPVNGEDTDLAWRAIESGAEPVFSAGAHVRHAVVPLGRMGFLRRNFRWGHAMGAFARHPGLRRERLFYRWFWNLSHWWLVRLAVALALPRRRWLWPLKLWLGWRYVDYRLPHPRTQRPSVSSLAWFLLADAVEVAGIARGAVKHRVVVL